MSEEKMKILEMLDKGKITVEDASILLASINQNQGNEETINAKKIKEQANKFKENVSKEAKTFVEDIKQLGKDFKSTKDKVVFKIENSDDIKNAKEKFVEFSTEISKSIDESLKESFNAIKDLFESENE